MNSLIVLAALPVPLSVLSHPVRIQTGSVEGARDGATTTYKSIPFAAPPVATSAGAHRNLLRSGRC